MHNSLEFEGPPNPTEEIDVLDDQSIYSGKPEIQIADSYERYLESKWQNRDSKVIPTTEMDDLMKYFALTSKDSVTISKLNTGEGNPEFIDIGSDYNENIYLHQILRVGPVEEANGKPWELEDIVFIDKQTGKSFNVRSILSENIPFNVVPDLKFKAWGGQSIEIPPLGRNNPPLNPIFRGMWNVYKKVEPVVIFHEIAHTRQNFDRRDPEQVVESERDAWRFGLQCLRKLRENDIDLLPGVSNTEILSRLELGLINYDFSHSENLPKRFSRRMSNSENNGGPIHDLKHAIKYVSAVLKTAVDDPSLITDTLAYKGK